MKESINNNVNEIRKKLLHSMIAWCIESAVILLLLVIAVLTFEELIFIFIGILYCSPFIIMIILRNNISKYLYNNYMYIIGIILSLFTGHFITSILFLQAYLDKRTLIKIIKQHEIDDNDNIFDEAFPDIVKEKKEKEKISPEAKRIDLLMKIGVFFVIIAGFLFATSVSNSVFFDKIKPFFLLFLSFMFFGLSEFFSKKVIIKKSEHTYYFLFHLFLILFFVSLGFYETFGEWFSFSGDGCELFIALVLGISSVSFRIIGNKFDFDIMKNVSYGSIYLSILSVLLFLNLEFAMIYFTLLLVSLIMFYLIKEEHKFFLPVRNILLVISFLYLIFNVNSFLNFKEYMFDFVVFSALVCNIFTLCKYDEKKYLSILSGVCVIYLEMFFGNLIDTLFDNNITLQIYFFSLILLYLFLFYYNNKNKKLDFVFDLSLVIMTVINSIKVTNFDVLLLGLIANLIIFAFIFINIMFAKDIKYKKTILVFQYAYLLISLVLVRMCLDEYLYFTFDDSYFVMIYLCFVAFINYIEDVFIKEIKLDVILYLVVIVILGLISIITLPYVSIMFNTVILLVLLIYRFYFDKINKDNVFLNYFMLLLGLTHVSNLLFTYIFKYADILVFISLIICGIVLLRKNKRFFAIAMILSFIPYFNFIVSLNLVEEVTIISIVIPLLILVHLFTKFILDCDKKIKFWLEMVGMAIVFSLYSFNINVIAAIFNLLLGVIFIFIGNKNEKFESLFYIGIVLLVVDVIVQFSEYWFKIPIYVYIFLLGILLVGYATYRELNKNKPKTSVKDVDRKITYYESKEYNIEYNILGVVTIISVLFLVPLYENLRYEMKNKYESKIFYNEIGKYMDDLGLDKTKYMFVYGEYSPEVYIEMYNTLDPYHFMDKFNFDRVSLYWADKNTMKNNIDSFDSEFDYYYDFEEYTTFYKEKVRNNVFELDNYNVEIKSNIYDFEFERNPYNRNYLTLRFNKYEIEKLDICVNYQFGDNVTVSGSPYIYSYLNDENRTCYYVSGTDHIEFALDKKLDYNYDVSYPDDNNDELYQDNFEY